MAAGRGQSRPGAGHFWLHGPGEHHADRVEEDELGMMSDGLGDRVPRRVGDEVRELFDSFAHPELLVLSSSLSMSQLNPSSFSATVRLSSTIATMRSISSVVMIRGGESWTDMKTRVKRPRSSISSATRRLKGCAAAAGPQPNGSFVALSLTSSTAHMRP